MRMPFVQWVMGLTLLASLAGGCGVSQGPVTPLVSPMPLAVSPDAVGPRRVRHEVVLEFQIVDEVSRKAIEIASLETRNAYRGDSAPIRAVKNGAGIWRLVFQSWYVPQPELPPESYFLGGLWLDINAPGYEPVKASLRNFVGERRPIDEVPSENSAPLVVTLRKGERERRGSSTSSLATIGGTKVSPLNSTSTGTGHSAPAFRMYTSTTRLGSDLLRSWMAD